MSRNRIDVHTHLIPPFWAEELKSHGGDPSGWGAPDWSPEALLAFMDSRDIATSILSLTAPGIEGWGHDERPDIARRVNDYGAGLVRDDPKRIGYLATLPMPDVEASLVELRRCFDDLGVDGVCLHSNFDGRYLGDAAFDAIWQELDRHAATVLIHPTTPAGVLVLAGQPSPMEDYPADTTKSAFDLVCAGHLRRYPSVRIILSHGGGFLPYVATRLAELRASLEPSSSAEQLLQDMRRFYFDTALVAPSGMPSLLAFVDPDHIVFGTDFPYASEQVSTKFTANLDAYPIGAADHSTIDRGAARLFPRLADGQATEADREETDRGRGHEVVREMMGDALADELEAAADSGTFGAAISAMAIDQAFGDIWTRPGLSRRDRSLVTLAVMVALRQPNEYAVHMNIGLNNGLTLREIEEALIQTLPYVGYPAVSTALRSAGKVIEERELDTNPSYAGHRGLL